jgi:Leucine-rich repeat (LRR) protein
MSTKIRSGTSAYLLILLNKLNSTEFPMDYVFENTEVMFDDDDIIGIFLPGRKLTGPFPDLSPFTHLYHLDLSNNELTSLEVKKLPTSLINFELYKNKFEGKIPNLVTLDNLRAIDLSENKFTGFDPEEEFPVSLNFMYLNNNKLSDLPDLS